MKKLFTLLVCGLMALMTTKVFAYSDTYSGTFNGGEYVITIYDGGSAYLTITTHGKPIPKFVNDDKKSVSPPWVDYQERMGGDDGIRIVSIITDASFIPGGTFRDMEYVVHFQADNCKEIDGAPFVNCGRPGFTLYLPNLEEASPRTFMRCNAGVIVLPKLKRVEYDCFMGCPALKQVDFGDALEEIDEWAFGCCPMMWIDDEPNIIFHGKNPPSIARGYYDPKNTIMVGYGAVWPSEVTYPFYYSTCFDDVSLADTKLYPYLTSVKKKKNCSPFYPQPDGAHFNGKPVILIPTEWDETSSLESKWNSLMNKFKDDVLFYEGGRIETASNPTNEKETWRNQYIGWWHRGGVDQNEDIHICSYGWAIKDYITEEQAMELMKGVDPAGYDPTVSKLSLHDKLPTSLINLRKKQQESGMPWMESFNTANVLKLHVKTPRIIPFMFGPALNCLSEASFEGVREIATGAFFCTGLPNDIDLSSVEKIGYSAFQMNNFLKDITLSSVGQIGIGAFNVSPYLSKVVLGNEIEEIPAYAFLSCHGLEEVYVGNHVTKIGDAAFQYTQLDNDNSEKGLYMSARAPQLGSGVFDNLSLEKIWLHHPGGEYASYDAEGSVWRKMNRVSDISFPLTGDGWSLTAEGDLTVSKNITVGSASNQPWKDYRRYIKRIFITNDVTEIDAYAFASTAEQSHLSSVYLGKSVRHIGKYAFSGNDELEFIRTIDYDNYDPNSKVNQMFYNEYENAHGYRLNNFFIYLSTVETIGDRAFADCNRIRVILLGEKMQALGSYILKGTQVWEVEAYNTTPLPIDKYTFAGIVDGEGNARELKDINCWVRNEDFSSQLTYLTTPIWKEFHYEIGDLEVWYNGSHGGGNFVLTSDSVMHVWPVEGTTRILPYETWGRDAISWEAKKVTTARFGSDNDQVADKVKKVVFEGNITEIGGACCFLPNLTEVEMPATVKLLRGTFYGCENLKEVNLPHVEDFGGAGGVTMSSSVLRFDVITHGVDLFKGTFAYCPNLEYVNAPNVKILGDSTFTGCAKLTTDAVDDLLCNGSVERVGGYAFKGCKSIEYVDLWRVKYVSGYAFANCTSVEWVDMGENAPIYGMFEGCTALRKVYLGSMTKTIGRKAFNGCDIENIYIATPNPPDFDLWADETIQDNIFNGQLLSTINVYTYGDFISRYREAKGWKEMTVRVVPGSESYAAIPIGGYLSSENYTNPAKWEITVGRSLNIYGEGVVECKTFYNEDKKANYIDPHVSYYWDYIDQVYINKGVTELKTRLLEFRLGSETSPWQFCKKIYIPSTMEKMDVYVFNEAGLLGSQTIEDVYCYAVNPPDISYSAENMTETMRVSLTAFGTLMEYTSGEHMSDNEELRKELCIPRLHVLRDSGVKEAYEAAPGYKEQFLEIIADLVDGDEVVIPNSYSVTFVDWDEHWISTQVVEEGGAATAPDDPVREGYTFLGWDTDFDNVQANLVVTAQYQEIPVPTYTVFFLDWDGTELSSQKVKEGQSAYAPIDPVREGYVFVGWNRDFSVVTSDLTVMALYTEAETEKFTVFFLDWDGTELKQEQVSSGGDATPPADPVRKGYTFTGWDKDYTNVQENLVIHALYTENEKEIFTVFFLDWDGTELKQEQVSAGEDATPPADPVREGYTFVGWDKDYTNVQENLVIRALYTENEKEKFTVFFLDWDGTELKQEQVSAGEDATPPADPVRAGYTFTGWDKDYTNVQENLVIHALYEPNKEGIEDVQGDNVQCTKVLRNGVLYLMYEGQMYDVQGKKVK